MAILYFALLSIQEVIVFLLHNHGVQLIMIIKHNIE